MDLLDIGLYLGYITLFVAIAGAVALPLINALKDPAGLLKSLAGFGILIVLFLVAYALSSSELTKIAIANGISENGTKMIGGGLITFYALFLFSVVGLLFSEVSKALK